MRIGDDFKPYFRPQYLYKFEKHFTTPNDPWDKNPVKKLARRLQQMSLDEHITEGSYKVRKTWSKMFGTRFNVYASSGGRVLTCKRADEAAKFVLQGTGMEEYCGS